MSERELSEIESPFVYLEELDKKAGALLRVGENIISTASWESLPEYRQEIRKIVTEFERVPVLLEEARTRILEDQRRREEEKRLEEERQRIAREEQRQREEQYKQQIATFRTAYQTFQTKPNWQNTNSALVAGEVLEANPLFTVDARAVALGTQLSVIRNKKAYLEEVRLAAQELLAEQQAAAEAAKQTEPDAAEEEMALLEQINAEAKE